MSTERLASAGVDDELDRDVLLDFSRGRIRLLGWPSRDHAPGYLADALSDYVKTIRSKLAGMARALLAPSVVSPEKASTEVVSRQEATSVPATVEMGGLQKWAVKWVGCGISENNRREDLAELVTAVKADIGQALAKAEREQRARLAEDLRTLRVLVGLPDYAEPQAIAAEACILIGNLTRERDEQRARADNLDRDLRLAGDAARDAARAPQGDPDK